MDFHGRCSLLLLAFFVPGVFNQCNENANWMRSSSLDPTGVMSIKWNFTDTDITMLVAGRTTGWIGVGFSSEKPSGSDHVMGWFFEGNPVVKDYLSVNRHPVLDPIQNYELVGAFQNETHTVMCWNRKLDTGDANDYKIENTVIPLAWSWENNITNIDTVGPLYHGPINRGTIKLRLLEPEVIQLEQLSSTVAYR